MTALYEARGLLLSGTLVTLGVFAGASVLAALLALVFGLARGARNSMLRIAATCWVEFFRGVSTAVLLFWLYFALPFYGPSLSPATTAIIGLGLVHGAYGSEIVRGAVQSIGGGQREAAAALGLSRARTLRLVIWPQAFAAMLPPLGNALILLLKGTSIASIITLKELTSQSTTIVTQTLAIVPVFLCVMLIYYGIAVSLTFVMRRIERRATRWRFLADA